MWGEEEGWVREDREEKGVETGKERIRRERRKGKKRGEGYSYLRHASRA